MHDALTALANPRRREIVRLVWDRERSAGEIAASFDVSWPAISQNLRILKETGLLTERREVYASPEAARWMMLYSVADGWPVRDLAAPEED